MRKLLAFCLFVVSLFKFIGPAEAQAPAPCGTPTLGQMPQNFKDWHWDVPPEDPDYCRMWIVNRTNNMLVKVDAPWVAGRNGYFYNMQVSKDYMPAKGWVLIKRDFGSRTAIQIPYFVLYNKYSGLLRAFFYVDNSAGTYNSGVVIRLDNVQAGGNKSSGVLSLSNALIPAADKYLQGTTSAAETMTYVTVYNSQTNWVMGEFNMSFDPNIGSSSYQASALQFSILGIVDNQVALSGALNWKTDRNDGYGFGGKTANVVDPSNVNKFLSKGQKLLGKVSADDAAKFLQKINDGAADVVADARSGSSLESAALNIFKITKASSGLSSTIGSILKVAGGVNVAFGLIGSVLGFLSPESTATAAPAFIPTVSTGSISLDGAITCKTPLTGAVIQVGGSQHSSDRTTQPYYNCALGIFNLKNTPVLNVIEHIEDHTYNGNCNALPIYGSTSTDSPCRVHYKSYQVNNNLIATYNQAAGLKLVSVQAALVGEFSRKAADYNGHHELDKNSSYYDILSYSKTFSALRMLRQLSTGVAEQVNGDDKIQVYQTPFVDLGSFRNIALTAFADDRVYVRIKAVLQRTDEVDTSPIYFVQDYAFDSNTNATPSNPDYVASDVTYETPFTNYASKLVDNSYNSRYNSPPAGAMYDHVAVSDPGSDDPDGSNYGYFQSYYYLHSGRFTTPSINSFYATLAYPNPSAPSGGSAIYDHPNSSGTSYLMAVGSIALGPGFSVTSGTNFVASTSLLEAKVNQNYSPPLIESLTAACPYNDDPNTGPYARQMVVAAASSTTINESLVIAPNPAAESFVVTTNATYSGSTLLVLNILGQVVRRVSQIPLGTHITRIDMNGMSTGVYMVKLITENSVTSQKVELR